MMHVKRYLAPTFAEALIQAKNELGSDALIVETKKVRTGGLWGLLGRYATEVTAALEVPTPGSKPAAAPVGQRTAPGMKPEPASAAGFDGIKQELASLRSMMMRALERGPGGRTDLSGIGRQVYETLMTRGASESAAAQFGLRMQQVTTRQGYGANLLGEELQKAMGPLQSITVPPGQRKVVALVGPTGVGKTTTIAKLGAKFRLECGLKVAFLTSDTFRIAAVEQLRTYGEIMGVPVYAVDTPGQVADALQKTAHCDLVLADTGGRNHKDAERMRELREMLAILRPDETHLVLSMTASTQDAEATMESFLPMGVNRLTLTKLDESVTPAMLLHLRSRCQHPLGYLATGQSVPDDLQAAENANFAQIVLGV